MCTGGTTTRIGGTDGDTPAQSSPGGQSYWVAGTHFASPHFPLPSPFQANTTNSTFASNPFRSLQVKLSTALSGGAGLVPLLHLTRLGDAGHVRGGDNIVQNNWSNRHGTIQVKTMSKER